MELDIQGFLNSLPISKYQRKILDDLLNQTPSPTGDRDCEELKEALEDLVDAVPRQLEDADWWDDDLTKAVTKAKQLLK